MRAPCPQGRSPTRLARRASLDATAEAEPFIALSRARERAGAGGAVLVTGSLYLLERLRAAALEAR